MDREVLAFHLAFYLNAEERDQTFFKNLRGSLHGGQAWGVDRGPTVIVAGGFHTQGMTEILKRSETSYAVITPKISNLPETSLYREHMQGNVSWKNYFKVENGKIKPYDAFVRATRDRLLSRATGHEPRAKQDKGVERGSLNVGRSSEDLRLLKSWRDQIIRDLSDQGRAHDAWKYTKFLDEILSGHEPRATNHEGVAERLSRRVDQFVSGLRALNITGKLNQQNVAGLLRSMTVVDGFTVNALAPNVEVTALIASPTLPVAENVFEDNRFVIGPLILEGKEMPAQDFWTQLEAKSGPYLYSDDLDQVRKKMDDYFPENAKVLDLMGGAEISFNKKNRKIYGIGLNKSKLAQNLDYDEFAAHDLNDASLQIPFAERGPFDAVVVSLGVMYWKNPVETLKRIRALMKPEGKIVFLYYGNAWAKSAAVRVWNEPNKYLSQYLNPGTRYGTQFDVLRDWLTGAGFDGLKQIAWAGMDDRGRLNNDTYHLVRAVSPRSGGASEKQDPKIPGEKRSEARKLEWVEDDDSAPSKQSVQLEKRLKKIRIPWPQANHPQSKLYFEVDGVIQSEWMNRGANGEHELISLPGHLIVVRPNPKILKDKMFSKLNKEPTNTMPISQGSLGWIRITEMTLDGEPALYISEIQSSAGFHDLWKSFSGKKNDLRWASAAVEKIAQAAQAAGYKVILAKNHRTARSENQNIPGATNRDWRATISNAALQEQYKRPLKDWQETDIQHPTGWETKYWVKDLTESSLMAESQSPLARWWSGILAKLKSFFFRVQIKPVFVPAVPVKESPVILKEREFLDDSVVQAMRAAINDKKNLNQIMGVLEIPVTKSGIRLRLRKAFFGLGAFEIQMKEPGQEWVTLPMSRFNFKEKRDAIILKDIAIDNEFKFVGQGMGSTLFAYLYEYARLTQKRIEIPSTENYWLGFAIYKNWGRDATYEAPDGSRQPLSEAYKHPPAEIAVEIHAPVRERVVFKYQNGSYVQQWEAWMESGNRLSPKLELSWEGQRLVLKNPVADARFSKMQYSMYWPSSVANIVIQHKPIEGRSESRYTKEEIKLKNGAQVFLSDYLSRLKSPNVALGIDDINALIPKPNLSHRLTLNHNDPEHASLDLLWEKEPGKFLSVFTVGLNAVAGDAKNPEEKKWLQVGPDAPWQFLLQRLNEDYFDDSDKHAAKVKELKPILDMKKSGLLRISQWALSRGFEAIVIIPISANLNNPKKWNERGFRIGTNAQGQQVLIKDLTRRSEMRYKPEDIKLGEGVKLLAQNELSGRGLKSVALTIGDINLLMSEFPGDHELELMQNDREKSRLLVYDITGGARIKVMNIEFDLDGTTVNVGHDILPTQITSEWRKVRFRLKAEALDYSSRQRVNERVKAISDWKKTWFPKMEAWARQQRFSEISFVPISTKEPNVFSINGYRLSTQPGKQIYRKGLRSEIRKFPKEWAVHQTPVTVSRANALDVRLSRAVIGNRLTIPRLKIQITGAGIKYSERYIEAIDQFEKDYQGMDFEDVAEAWERDINQQILVPLGLYARIIQKKSDQNKPVQVDGLFFEMFKVSSADWTDLVVDGKRKQVLVLQGGSLTDNKQMPQQGAIEKINHGFFHRSGPTVFVREIYDRNFRSSTANHELGHAIQNIGVFSPRTDFPPMKAVLGFDSSDDVQSEIFAFLTQLLTSKTIKQEMLELLDFQQFPNTSHGAASIYILNQLRARYKGFQKLKLLFGFSEKDVLADIARNPNNTAAIIQDSFGEAALNSILDSFSSGVLRRSEMRSFDEISGTEEYKVWVNNQKSDYHKRRLEILNNSRMSSREQSLKYQELDKEFIVRVEAKLTELFGEEIIKGKIAFLAVGSSPRGTAAYGSDLDAKALVRSLADVDELKPALEFVARSSSKIFGVNPGWGIVTLDELNPKKEMHVQILSELIDAKFEAGNEALFGQFQAQLTGRLQSAEMKKSEVVKMIRFWEKSRERNNYFEGLFDREPNIKNGAGGLRDMEFSRWIIKIMGEAENFKLPAKEELLKAEKAYQFLIQVRQSLHKVQVDQNGKLAPEEERDIFKIQYHSQVAREMRYKDEVGVVSAQEQLMSDYRQAAQTLFLFNNRVSRRALHALGLLHFEHIGFVEAKRDYFLSGVELVMRTGKTVMLDRGLIYLAEEGQYDLVLNAMLRDLTGNDYEIGSEEYEDKKTKFADKVRNAKPALTIYPDGKIAPRDIPQIFKVAAKNNYDINGSLTDAIEEARPDFQKLLLDPDYRKEALQAFSDLLALNQDISYVLFRMQVLGVLADMLPEYARMQSQVINDIKHQYTLDAYAVASVKYLDEMMGSQDRFAVLQPHIEAVRRSDSMRVLRAVLMVQAFANREEDAAQKILNQMGLSEEETKLAHWLIQNKGALLDLMRIQGHESGSEFAGFWVNTLDKDPVRWSLLVLLTQTLVHFFNPWGEKIYSEELQDILSLSEEVLKDPAELREFWSTKAKERQISDELEEQVKLEKISVHSERDEITGLVEVSILYNAEKLRIDVFEAMTEIFDDLGLSVESMKGGRLVGEGVTQNRYWVESHKTIDTKEIKDAVLEKIKARANPDSSPPSIKPIDSVRPETLIQMQTSAVEVYPGYSQNSTFVRLTTPDRPQVLRTAAILFRVHGIKLLPRSTIDTIGYDPKIGMLADDIFELSKEGRKLTQEEMGYLFEDLKQIFSLEHIDGQSIAIMKWRHWNRLFSARDEVDFYHAFGRKFTDPADRSMIPGGDFAFRFFSIPELARYHEMNLLSEEEYHFLVQAAKKPFYKLLRAIDDVEGVVKQGSQTPAIFDFVSSRGLEPTSPAAYIEDQKDTKPHVAKRLSSDLEYAKRFTLEVEAAFEELRILGLIAWDGNGSYVALSEYIGQSEATIYFRRKAAYERAAYDERSLRAYRIISDLFRRNPQFIEPQKREKVLGSDLLVKQVTQLKPDLAEMVSIPETAEEIELNPEVELNPQTLSDFLSQVSGLPISIGYATREKLRTYVDRMNEADVLSLSPQFRAWMQSSKNIMPFIRLIDEIGLLGKMMPEFQAIKTVYDDTAGFHHFSVGAHSLLVLENAEKILEGAILGNQLQAYPEIQKWLTDDDFRLALRMSALGHDSAKTAKSWSYQASHQIIGAREMIPRIMQRLGFDEAAIQDVQWITWYHQHINEAARAMGSGGVATMPSLQLEWLDKVKRQATPMRLALLYLFSFADALGLQAGPGHAQAILGSNQARNVHAWYQFVSDSTSPAEEVIRAEKEKEDRDWMTKTLSELKTLFDDKNGLNNKLLKMTNEMTFPGDQDFKNQFRDKFMNDNWENIEKGLLDYVSRAEVDYLRFVVKDKGYMEIINRFLVYAYMMHVKGTQGSNVQGPAAAVYSFNREAQGFLELVLADADDRPGVLAKVFGVFAAYGLSAHNAVITTEGGLIFDIFRATANLPIFEETKEKIRKDVISVLRGEKELKKIYEEQRRPYEFYTEVSPEKLSGGTVRWEKSPNGSRQRVYLENFADRDGFIHLVARLFAEGLEVGIVHANLRTYPLGIQDVIEFAAADLASVFISRHGGAFESIMRKLFSLEKITESNINEAIDALKVLRSESRSQGSSTQRSEIRLPDDIVSRIRAFEAHLSLPEHKLLDSSPVWLVRFKNFLSMQPAPSQVVTRSELAEVLIRTLPEVEADRDTQKTGNEKNNVWIEIPHGVSLQFQTPWGQVDLARLNNLNSYLAFPDIGGADLARDLEIAHSLGIFEIEKFGPGLSASAFIKDINTRLKGREGNKFSSLSVSWRDAQNVKAAMEQLIMGNVLKLGDTEIQFTANDKAGGTYQVNQKGKVQTFTYEQGDDVQGIILDLLKVEHWGAGYSAIPPAVIAQLKWSMMSLNGKQAKHLRDTTYALERGDIVEIDGTKIHYIADPDTGGSYTVQFKEKDEPEIFTFDERDEVQAIVYRLIGVEHWSNGHGAIPSSVKKSLKWSQMPLNGKQALDLRNDTSKLADEGEVTIGNTKIQLLDNGDYRIEVKVKVQSEEKIEVRRISQKNRDEVQGIILDLHGISNWGAGYSAIPGAVIKKLKWSKMDLNGSKAKELRDKLNELVDKGSVVIKGTKISFEADQDTGGVYKVQFKGTSLLDGFPFEARDDVQAIVFELLQIEHWGNGYSVIPEAVKDALRWRVMNLNGKKAQELRGKTRALLNGEVIKIKDVTLQYFKHDQTVSYVLKDANGGIRKFSFDDGDEVYAIILDLLDVEHLGNGYSAIPHSVKKSLNWSMTDLNGKQAKKVRDSTRALWEQGIVAIEDVTIEYDRKTKLYKVVYANGTNEVFTFDEGDEVQGMIFDLLNIEHWGTGYFAVPKVIRSSLSWTYINLNGAKAKDLRGKIKKLVRGEIVDIKGTTIKFIQNKTGGGYEVKFKGSEKSEIFEYEDRDEVQSIIYDLYDIDNFGLGFTAVPKPDNRILQWRVMNLNNEKVKILRSERLKFLQVVGTPSGYAIAEGITLKREGEQYWLTGKRISSPVDLEPEQALIIWMFGLGINSIQTAASFVGQEIRLKLGFNYYPGNFDSAMKSIHPVLSSAGLSLQDFQDRTVAHHKTLARSESRAQGSSTQRSEIRLQEDLRNEVEVDVRGLLEQFLREALDLPPGKAEKQAEIVLDGLQTLGFEDYASVITGLRDDLVKGLNDTEEIRMKQLIDFVKAVLEQAGKTEIKVGLDEPANQVILESVLREMSLPDQIRWQIPVGMREFTTSVGFSDRVGSLASAGRREGNVLTVVEGEGGEFASRSSEKVLGVVSGDQAATLAEKRMDMLSRVMVAVLLAGKVKDRRLLQSPEGIQNLLAEFKYMGDIASALEFDAQGQLKVRFSILTRIAQDFAARSEVRKSA